MKTPIGKLAIAVILLVSPVRAADLAPAKDRVVVMISLDGLAGFYFDDPKAEMPTLRALTKQGAASWDMRAVGPTVTWPNHTTLVTGDWPSHHGVTGNNYFDRETGKPVQLISDPIFDKTQIVKVPTIYDLAKEAGLTTAAIRWPATRNAPTLDWTSPDVGTRKLYEQLTTPSLLAAMKAAHLWPPPSTQPTTNVSAATTEPAEGYVSPTDEAATQTFLMILRQHHPNFGLLHLIDVDHQEHQFGPRSKEAYEAIANVDAQVKEVWDELQTNDAGRATIVIVSDHGFSPIDRVVLPNVVLRDAGLLDVKGVRVVGGAVRVVVQGGCAMVYVTDTEHRDEVLAKARQAFVGIAGVEKPVDVKDFAKYGIADPKDDPHAPDLVLFADEGYAFGDTAAGSLTFQEKPERKGTHGHDPDLPHLHAMFVAAGVGIAPGVNLGTFQNTDVAPTVAKLIGVKMTNVDGKPLDAALLK